MRPEPTAERGLDDIQTAAESGSRRDRSCAVAALELLARPHQQGSLRPMSRSLVLDDLVLRRAAHRGGGAEPTGGGDRVGAGGGLVLVREHLGRLDGRERLLGLVLLHLDVEERRDDLLADERLSSSNMMWPSPRYSTSGSFWAIARRWTPSRR